ncbi:MAG TPA: tetratricopeptide repeat protein, partial [Polyangiaceae bacterium]
MLELTPDDDLVLAGLEEVRKRAGKHEELIEMLLQRNERTGDARERARTFAEIGRIYVRALNDREQALVAFTQAFVEEPLELAHTVELHDAAGSDRNAWEDVLRSLEETLRGSSLPTATESALRSKMAEWYQAVLGRPDLACACLERMLEKDPTNDAALESLSASYRRAQRWRELAEVLTRRADRATAPLARDLSTEAAEVLEHQLHDLGAARDLYERVFAQDPSHRRAADGLCRITERTEDYPALADVLRRRIEAHTGDERLKQLCRLAEVEDARLGDGEAAVKTYESVLALNPEHQEALRGLDQVLTRTGRHQELLEILEREVRLAPTPRQKIALQERVAELYEREFLDHERASLARETILEWDGSNRDALTRLLANYRALGRWEPLSALYERLLELTPDRAERVELALAWGQLLNDDLHAPERAASAYELVLDIAPNQAKALDALARLGEATGDRARSIDALLALADTAETPHDKARQLERAAKIFEKQKNLERAIEVYEQAVDVEPDNAALRKALRDAYLERGDVVLALELFERELSRAEGEHAKARLASQMARLARHRLHDEERAEAAAKQALSFDPTDLEALAVLGDLAYEHERFVEASRYYEAIAGRIDTLPPAEAKRTLLRSIEALGRTDRWQKAAGLRERLLALADRDAETSERLAHLTLEFGDTASALAQYRALLTRFEGELSPARRAEAEYRYGEALHRSGEALAALARFERASELDASQDRALAAQARVHAELGDWPAAVAIKRKQLATADADARFQLWAEIGDIAHEQLNDRAQAAESYTRALETRPDERRVLTRLMQLYSEEQQWENLVGVVVRIANYVDDAAQKAKYLETAAAVMQQQIGDASQALQYYERAFALAPSLRAIDEALEIYRADSAHTEIERLLRLRLELATKDGGQEGNKAEMLKTFNALADLYEHALGDVDNAIDAHEAAQTLDPTNEARAEILTELYGTDLLRYAARAVKLHGALIEANPERADSYRVLRRVYTATGNTDASWCLCQTLSVLGLSDADERRFYARSRLAQAAPVQRALSDEDWLATLLHPLVDPLLTSVFALIEPAVIESRAEPLEAFGYTEAHRVAVDSHYAALSQSLHHAAGALGVPLPPVYENTNDPGGLSFLHTFEPAVVLGNAALNAEVPSQAAAFVAARHLTYLRPGLYLRQLVGTGTGLKSWLFAAIQLTAPQ